MLSITVRIRSGTAGDVAAVLVAAVLVAVAALVGAIARNHDVPIHADTAPLYARWLPHLGPGTIPTVLVGALVVLFGPRLAAQLSWRKLLAAAYLGSLVWTLSLALVDGWERGVTGRLTTPTEYLAEVPRVDDVSTMLSTFADRITGISPQTWITHVAGHPPGATLIFVGLDRLGLSSGAAASVLCIVVGASAAVAVAVTLRALGHETAARAALPFGVLLPGAVWVGASADGLFAGVLAWGVALFALGATGTGARGAIATAAGGLVLGGTLYLSYGLVLAAFFPLAVLAVTRRLWPLLIATAAVIAVVAAFAALGFWWFDGYEQVQQRYYQPGEYGLERPYWYWVWANL
ncbi:MAG: hypothetical protein ACRDTC_22460, partial [Pseudonocardiaceae bacterium]